jgi:hypothetical protein
MATAGKASRHDRSRVSLRSPGLPTLRIHTVRNSLTPPR